MAGASSGLQTKRELGKATRDAFGRALEALGADHPDIVVVDGDVSNSTRTEWFGKKHPDRFFNVGIAESNLVGVAAGLASSGKTSVIASFAALRRRGEHCSRKTGNESVRRKCSHQARTRGRPGGSPSASSRCTARGRRSPAWAPRGAQLVAVGQPRDRLPQPLGLLDDPGPPGQVHRWVAPALEAPGRPTPRLAAGRTQSSSGLDCVRGSAAPPAQRPGARGEATEGAPATGEAESRKPGESADQRRRARARLRAPRVRGRRRRSGRGRGGRACGGWRRRGSSRSTR